MSLVRISLCAVFVWFLFARPAASAAFPAQSEGEFSVRVAFPAFLYGGDEFAIHVHLYNHRPADVEAWVSLRAEGVDVREAEGRTVDVPAGAGATVVWNAAADQAAEAQLVVEVKANGETFEEKTTLPILPAGDEAYFRHRGRLWQREWLVSYLNPGARVTNSQLWFSTSLLAMLLKDYAQWQALGYDNNTQAAALLTAAVALWEALGRAGVQDRTEARSVRADIVRAAEYLLKQQNDDGGWGWWAGDESRSLQTAQVADALFSASRAGLLEVSAEAQRAALKALERHWGRSGNRNLRAYLLYVLSRGNQEDSTRSLLRLAWLRRDNLQTPYLAYLGMALDDLAMLSPDEREDVLTVLQERADESATFVWWKCEPETGEVPEDDRYATAVTLRALFRWSSDAEWLEKAVEWLLRSCPGCRVVPDMSTAQVMAALAESTRWPEPPTAGSVRVNLEGIPVLESAVDEGDPLKASEVDLNDLKPGANWLEILLEGSGPLYYDWSLHSIFANRPLRAARSMEGFVVNRRYLDPDTRESRTDYRADEFILVQVELTSGVAHHYVVVEAPLPAGCRPVVGSLTFDELDHSPLQINSRGDRMTFLLPVLPQGKHMFSYLLRTEIPGRFQVRPASASLVHRPAIWGRSAADSLTISVD